MRVFYVEELVGINNSVIVGVFSNADAALACAGQKEISRILCAAEVLDEYDPNKDYYLSE